MADELGPDTAGCRAAVAERYVGQSIFTEAESMEELKVNIKDAVLCHFEEGSLLKVIRLHYVKDEVMSL